MNHNLESAMESTGAQSEQIFRAAFENKSANEINDILIEMLGYNDGNDIEFAEQIVKILSRSS